MLASPLYPAAPLAAPLTPDEQHARPAKDLDAFNSLLPPPIEFVEGSSTGALALAEGKYEPINASPPPAVSSRLGLAVSVGVGVAAGAGAGAGVGAAQAQTQTQTQTHPGAPLKPARPSTGRRQLYSGALDLTWPAGSTVGNGLHNTGNTCFLNSALQCLLHTPPLLRILHAHSQSDPCKISSGGFCMTCSLRQVMVDSHQKSRPFTPFPITSKLHLIAKHMRKGRQEDSHEFLRYAIDALQKSCLAGYTQKVDHELAETTWVHKIFGGRLRSRVTCRECHHHSDTFDSILDISLDIYGSSTLREAFKRFVAVDYLKGEDKYRCDRCKKAVVAEKRFTVHDAPAVLTVHLKRFSPLGRKIGHFVHYDERLSLQPVMSEGQHGPSYSLYGIISHAGGGPNSGHYLAHVRAATGRWFQMNDDTVSPQFRAPVDMKNAYILFYIRDKGQSLDAAVHGAKVVSAAAAGAAGGAAPAQSKPSIVASMKKRKVPEDEDVGVRVEQPFIGPLLPSPALGGAARSSSSSSPPPDPQAVSLKNKIAAATAQTSTALTSLAQYGDDDDDDDDDSTDSAQPKAVESDMTTPTSPTASHPPTSSLPSGNVSDASTRSPSSNGPPSGGVNPSSFYATSAPASTVARNCHGSLANDKKRKSPDSETEDQRPSSQTTRYTHPSSPSSKQAPAYKRGQHLFSRNHGNHHDQHRRKSFGGGAVNPYNRVAGNNTLQYKYAKRRMLI